MNYRGLIGSLIGLVGIITGIFFAVRGLHRRGEEPEVTAVERTLEECRFPLLKAVPSDAAVILSLDGSREAAWQLTDSASVIPVLLSGRNAAISPKFLRKVASERMAVSLHDAGGLTPLLIIDSAEADSARVASMLSLADTVGLSYKYLPERGLLLVSPSNTLLGSSERHLEGGISVLDNRELLSATAALPEGNAIFLSNAAAPRIIRTVLSGGYLPYASFLSKVAVWMGFSLPERSAGRTEGVATTFGNTCYQSIFASMTPGEFKFREVIPAEARSVVALATDDIARYCALRRKWLDTGARLSAYKEANSAAKKSLGKPADQYMEELGLREAASALLPTGERLLALRYQNRPADGKEPKVYKAAYALSMLFGEMFRPQGDTLWSVVHGDWKFIGSREALARVGEKPLKGVAAASELLVDRGVFTLYNAGNNPSEVVSAAYSDPLRRRFRGAPLVASSLTAEPSAEGVRYVIRYMGVQQAPQPVARPSVTSADAAAAEPSAAAPVMTEYPVRHFQTGEMEVFFQGADHSLGLRDGSGKVLWTVPFDKPLAGRVKEIDYYGNGKIQYLFAAGTRLHVIDRQGRFVPSYSVDLGKEVLTGPDVYAFSEGEYDLMVLHTDNTLSLYTLEGAHRRGWKDISPRETVTGMPELLTVDDKPYWRVPLLSGDRYYRFEGGSALSRSKARKIEKRIRTKN